jgi:hypothetical protein
MSGMYTDEEVAVYKPLLQDQVAMLMQLDDMDDNALEDLFRRNPSTDKEWQELFRKHPKGNLDKQFKFKTDTDIKSINSKKPNITADDEIDAELGNALANLDRDEEYERMMQAVKKFSEKEKMRVDEDSNANSNYGREMGRSKNDSLKKELMIHLSAYRDKHIDGDDLAQAVGEIAAEITEVKALEKFTEAKDWIQKAIKRPGALHRALDIPRDKDIPHSLINKDIKKMDDLEDEEGHLDKRDLRFLRQLDLAKTLEKFNENKEPGKLSGIEDVINTLGDDDLEKIVAYMKERGRLTETVDEDIWVMAEKAVTHLGADKFAESLVRAMSTDDAKLYITGILKDWDIPMDDEDYAKYLNESLEESVVKNMITLLSDYGTESEINTYMDSVGREFMINPKSVEDYSDFSDDDWVEDFREWINDKYEDVREHFDRFIK